jgi:predicted methyltransferase
MPRKFFRLLSFFILITATAAPVTLGQQPDSPPAKPTPPKKKEDPQQRAKSLRTIAERLGVGPGCVIADIGAGKGRDSWIFADIVGKSGKVFAEEIDEGKTKALQAEADKRNLPQVKPLLGELTEPLLPADTADMAFMHYVYHHLSKPREMLRGIWRGLKPGGHLVIVDKQLGTLTDWVPRDARTKKHHWIGETTVVREAREEGFVFVECAEPCWHAKDTFVLVFQRPANLDSPDRDPDAPSPIPADVAKHLLPASGQTYGRVAFVALGEGRKLMGPILEASPSAAVDIVLEEWATQKDERPTVPAGAELPSVLTEKGDPKLGPEPLDAVFFLDTYHLLFHGPALLAQLHQRLTDSGSVYVLDRRAASAISHREASHRRMIAPETVKEEMTKAGFHLLREVPPPSEDRFLLVFGKTGKTAE